MIPFFKELLDYNHYFNQKMAGLFIEKPELISTNSLRLYSHTLNAHQIWNSRIESDQLPFGVWKIHSVPYFKSIDKTNFDRSLHILENHDLDEKITYTNSNGDSFENTVRDILFHIVNHSTYHRAQIVTELKENGLDSFSSDYVVYKR